MTTRGDYERMVRMGVRLSELECTRMGADDAKTTCTMHISDSRFL
jgi:hypothetical protein